MRNGRRTWIGRSAAWRTFLLSSCVVGLATGALAQTQPPVARPIGFDEAISLALERNPAVATAGVAVSEADAAVRVASAFTRPYVGATITNRTLDDSRGFSGGVTQPRNQFGFGLSASVPLVQPTRWSEINQARDRVDVAVQNVTETRRQVAMSTAQAYLSIIAGRRQLEVDERALEVARAHLDYATKRLEGGVGSRLNQLRAAQAVSEGEARLESTRLAVRRAQEALGVLVAEDGPVDAGEVPAFDPPPADLDASFVASRPDILAQDAEIRSADRIARDAWKAWLPTASLSFDPMLIAPAGLFQPSRTWSLVVSVTQPIFATGLRADAALKRVAVDRAELVRTSLEIQARSEVRIAREAVASEERALEKARLAAEQAEEVLQISSAAFEVGATTNIEVIDAQRTARDAETAAALAEDAVRRARLDLLVATGQFPR